MIIVPIFNNGLYPINYMCNVTLKRLYHAEIYFFPITCATDFFFFFCKKIAFSPLTGFKKHYVVFSKKLILALGERYKFVYRYVLCLNVFRFPVTPINQFLIILGRCTLYTPVCLQDEPTCMRIEPV